MRIKYDYDTMLCGWLIILGILGMIQVLMTR